MGKNLIEQTQLTINSMALLIIIQQAIFVAQKILLAIDPFFGITYQQGFLSWYAKEFYLPEFAHAGQQYLHQQYIDLMTKYSREKGNVFILAFAKGEPNLHARYIKRGVPDRLQEITGDWYHSSVQADVLLAKEAIKRFGRNRVVILSYGSLDKLPEILAGKLAREHISFEPNALLQVCGGIYSTNKAKPGCVDTYLKQVSEVLGLKAKPTILKNATITGQTNGKGVVFPWQRSQKARNRFYRSVLEILKSQWREMAERRGESQQIEEGIARIRMKEFRRRYGTPIAMKPKRRR